MSRTELLARINEGDVQVLDVRPADEFELAHIPGAINIPLASLKRKLAVLDPEKEVVAYCRGPWCILSFEAVSMLRAAGYRVRRLEDGLPEWKSASLPVSQASHIRICKGSQTDQVVIRTAGGEYSSFSYRIASSPWTKLCETDRKLIDCGDRQRTCISAVAILDGQIAGLVSILARRG